MNNISSILFILSSTAMFIAACFMSPDYLTAYELGFLSGTLLSAGVFIIE